MTVADNLRALVSELRPLIDERLDIDERISEIRGPASDKGLDFSQAKSLVIALARDSRDGGERVAKLTAKADNASWYADMLKSPTMAETSNNSPQSPADKSSRPHIRRFPIPSVPKRRRGRIEQTGRSPAIRQLIQAACNLLKWAARAYANSRLIPNVSRPLRCNAHGMVPANYGR